jgi:hypothetical protein
MSAMSTRRATTGAAVGTEFEVPGPWAAGPASRDSAARRAGGCGCQQPGGQRELHFLELHYKELHYRESRVRALPTRPAGVKPAGVRSDGVRSDGVRSDGVRPAGVRSAGVPPAGVRPAGAGSAGARPAPLRLTRRGRAVAAGLTVIAAAAVVILMWLAAAGGAQASSQGQPPGAGYLGMTKVVVRPGQTLWSIATSAEPSANPWVVMQQIVDANALSGFSVQAGELLWVPRG